MCSLFLYDFCSVFEIYCPFIWIKIRNFLIVLPQKFEMFCVKQALILLCKALRNIMHKIWAI